MSHTAEDIAREALRLPEEERVAIIEELWESLADDAAALRPGERDELARRSAALDDDLAKGRPVGRPWTEIRDELLADNEDE